MKFRTKHNIVAAFLIAFAAWPLAHFMLVQGLDISPWKLAGWAMYTTPPNSINVRVYRVENGERAEELPIATSNPRARFEMQQSYNRFGNRRVYFNTLVKPDDFARTIFKYFPGEDELEFVIIRWFINRSTGHVERITEDTTYRYRRDELE